MKARWAAVAAVAALAGSLSLVEVHEPAAQAAAASQSCTCTKTGAYVNPSATAPGGVAPSVDANGQSPNHIYQVTSALSGNQVVLTLSRVSDGSHITSFQISDSQAAWGFSPDDARFLYWDVVGGQEQYGLYDLATNQALPTVSPIAPSALEFSPKGGFYEIVTAATGQTAGSAMVLNAHTGAPVYLGGGNTVTPVDNVGFDPSDSTYMTYNNDGSAELYSLTTGSGLWNHGSGNPSTYGFSPGGKYLEVKTVTNSTDLSVLILDTSTGHSVYGPVTGSLYSPPAGSATQSEGTESSGFGPDDGSFVEAQLTSNQQAVWTLVSLPSGSATTVDLTGPAFWQYSPCGDVIALVQQVGQDHLDAGLYPAAGGSPTAVTPNPPITTVTFSSTVAAQVITYDGADHVVDANSCAPPAPAVSAVALPATANGGSPVTGTVTIATAAPTGGTVVSLASDHASVLTVPNGVTVAAGATTASFEATTIDPASDTSVIVTATSGGATETTTITVAHVAGLTGITLPSSTYGGQNPSGTLTLDSPAGASGITVTLTSDHPAVASVPPSVTVPAGQTSASFTVTTTVPADDTQVTITATANGATQTASIDVRYPTQITSNTVASPNVTTTDGESISVEVDHDLTGCPDSSDGDYYSCFIPSTITVDHPLIAQNHDSNAVNGIALQATGARSAFVLLDIGRVTTSTVVHFTISLDDGAQTTGAFTVDPPPAAAVFGVAGDATLASPPADPPGQPSLQVSLCGHTDEQPVGACVDPAAPNAVAAAPDGTVYFDVVGTDAAGDAAVPGLAAVDAPPENRVRFIAPLSGIKALAIAADGSVLALTTGGLYQVVPATGAVHQLVNGAFTDVAVTPAAPGIAYVTDAANHQVDRIDLTTSGDPVTVVASGGQLEDPEKLSADRAGVLYVGDWGSHAVVRIGTDGAVSTVAGSGSYSSSPEFPALSQEAQLYHPDPLPDGAGLLIRDNLQALGFVNPATPERLYYQDGCRMVALLPRTYGVSGGGPLFPPEDNVQPMALGPDGDLFLASHPTVDADGNITAQGQNGITEITAGFLPPDGYNHAVPGDVPGCPATVDSVSPGQGSTSGGDSITVNGLNLAGATTVDFGDTPGTDLVVSDDGTSLSVTSPAHAAGTVDVTVTAPAGTSATNPDDQYLFLAAQTISGTVYDATTYQPVQGICVYLYDTSGKRTSDLGTCTAADGSYSMPVAAPGEYDVAFYDPAGHYATQWSDDETSKGTADAVTVSTTEPTPYVDANLVPPSTVTGTVTDAATGAPLAGICVYPYLDTGARTTDAGTCTDGQGRYTLTVVNPGTSYEGYFFGFTDPTGKYATQWANGEGDEANANPVYVEAGQSATADAAMTTAATSISGTVIDATTHEPLAGVCTYLYGTVGASRTPDPGSCTDAAGHYILAVGKAGSYHVAFFDPTGAHTTFWYNGDTGYDTATTVTIAFGQEVTGIDAAMPSVGTGISGQVTSAADGRPLAGICVYLYTTDGQRTSDPGTCTNDEGYYYIPVIAAGSYHVAFFDPSGANATQWSAGAVSEATANTVTVTDGQVTSEVDAAMVGLGSISGTVTQAGGAAYPGVCVYADRLDGTYSGVGTCTDASGNYTLPGLPAGEYKLGFYLPGQAQGPAAPPTDHWYDYKSDEASADPVSVSTGAETSGIDQTFNGS